MSADVSYEILLLGLEPKARQFVEAQCTGASFRVISTADEFSDQYDKWTDGMFKAIICGSAFQGMSAMEAAQVLLNQCPGSIKYFITVDTTHYEPKNLLKNGFSACFALPIDAALLRQILVETVLSAVKKQRSFRSVRIFDLDAGDRLEFDTFVFLPLNKRYVKFSGEGTVLDTAKISKLQTKNLTQVFVDHGDMDKFYKYSAKKLSSMGGVSSTEKQEKLRDCVRGLFTDIFDQSIKADFDVGKEMVEQCEAIISNFITKGASSDWYKKLTASIGDSSDTYNHASNVSTFAALFAIGIGHAHPEDLAMAGLFHDLGLSQLPEELQDIKETLIPDEQKSLYYTHIEKSINLVKGKRIILTAEVEKAILQHHEKWNGKGWPKQIASARLSEESQILSFADQFDELTRLENGKRNYSPVDALEEIRRTGSINPELLGRIRRILVKDAGASSQSA